MRQLMIHRPGKGTLRRRLAAVVVATVAIVGVASVAQAADIHSTVTPGTTLTTATPATVAITSSGQNAYYTFSVTSADVSTKRVITAEISNATGLGGHFEVLDPTGAVFYDYGGIYNTTYTTAVVTTAGTYSVLIAPGTTTGSALLKVIKPVDVTGTVTLGTTLTTATPTTVTITDPGQKAYYSFTVTSADVSAKKVLTSEISNESGLGGHFEILDPTGAVFYDYGGIYNTTYTTPVLTTAGTYKVLIAPGTTTGSALVKVIEPVDVTGSITPGTTRTTATPTKIAITDPGQKAYYSFTVASADVTAKRVLTAEVSGNNGLGGHFEILDPTGAVFYDYGGIYNTTYTTPVLTTAGTYRVLIAPGTTTGNATLKLIEPADSYGTVTPGTALTTATPTVVSIVDPGQKSYYAFGVTSADVTARKVITGQISNASGLGGHFEILDPTGAVFYDYGGIYNITYTTPAVTKAGTYQVLIAPGTTIGSALLKVVK